MVPTPGSLRSPTPPLLVAPLLAGGRGVMVNRAASSREVV